MQNSRIPGSFFLLNQDMFILYLQPPENSGGCFYILHSRIFNTA